MKFYAQHTQVMRAFRHEMRYKKEKSSWKPKTRIVVIRNVQKGEKLFDVFFATSLPASLRLLRIYPGRWQIETNFRVMDEVKIKSKSNEHIVRYFYFMVQLLLHVAWNATKKLVEHVPFKRYLIKLAGNFRLLLKQGVT